MNAGKGEVRDSLGAQRIVDRNPSFEHLGELPLLLRAERVEVGANWRGGECGGKLLAAHSKVKGSACCVT